MDAPPKAKDIRAAAERIAPFVHRTPVLQSCYLNHLTGCTLFFKCENFQKAGAFKSRGAVNAVFSLGANESAAGVCTHSSGNHAQALARAAALRGIPAFIVMPENAPEVKVAAVKHYGGRITFCEPTLSSREETLSGLAATTGAIEIHPYNNNVIIAGQATAGMELIEAIPALNILLTPVGGGGLLSGTALSAHYFGKGIGVMAAEPAGADDAWRSLKEGRIVPSENPKTIADGLLTSLGSRTFPIIRQYVSAIHRVSEGGIIAAMQLIWERMKIVVEPSAATGLAAVLEYPDVFRGRKTGIILSGGNVDVKKLPW
jgi:threonine dehydratase